MRELIIVRIVHSPADMGSMQGGLTKEGMAKLGKERWLENQQKIEKFWDETEKEIDSLGLDWRKVRIYQDGMPCGGDLALKIVRETADKGSKNYQIIRKLLERGAVIEETESPGFLLKEYEQVKSIVSARSPEEKASAIKRYEADKDDLMRKRDEYIARQIDSTLKDGETGLLFIGASHNVRNYLAGDIGVNSLD